MSPFFSVVLPTYNHAHFLGRALQSLMDQTYPHWEALVIDNNSIDNTDDVVTSFCDPRIRLLKIHNNGIIAASRNMGISESAGDWIAFLDSDDCWYSNKLNIFMTYIKSNHIYDVLCNDELRSDLITGSKKVLRYGPYEFDFYKVLLLKGNRLSPSATIVRRDFLMRHSLGFDESPNYITVEDYDFWLKLAFNGASFKFIHVVLGEYVLHGGNCSSKFILHWRNCKHLLHDHVFNIQKFSPSGDYLWKEVYPRLLFGKLRYALFNGHFFTVFNTLYEILTSHPKGFAIYLSRALVIYLRSLT